MVEKVTVKESDAFRRQKNDILFLIYLKMWKGFGVVISDQNNVRK